jgi:phenylalanyl-tRNA synthetase alpha chain
MALNFEHLRREVEDFAASTKEELEGFRIKYLGKKGVLKEASSGLKDLLPEQRKQLGMHLNELKDAVQSKLESLQQQLEGAGKDQNAGADFSRPSGQEPYGSRHPVSMVRNEIENIFKRIGFTVAEGPEIENDWHNFTALNFPEEHPARDMQDTFFIEKDPDIALRTHTSSVQVRVMEKETPPIRTISPGRVYRNEAISARAHCIFHQVEGLYIDSRTILLMTSMTLTGNLPTEVSALNITASAPSSTALATSFTSALVGVLLSIMLSIICVATTTGFPFLRLLRMSIF